ncbi:MAG: RNA polymerase sigma factor [[Eubacterium] siraeum]|nr:RNA polymerase sigma factor [[Eubacterium] siraeum]
MTQDEEIVELYLKKDSSAIRLSKSKYGERLKQISYGITSDYGSAEEVENDTYFKAWENIPPHEPYTYLFAFLARIARNLSLSVCRERNRLKRISHIGELTAEMEECIPSKIRVEDDVDGRLLIDVINRFLKEQTEERRGIFMRRYWYLDSVASVAKRFGISQSNVKTTLFRLRNELKDFLESEGYNI